MASLGQTETKTTKTQVRAVECPQVPPLLLPHYEDPESDVTSPHASYHSLGHCLRTNIFPGAPLTWKSLVKESYISHPLPTPRTDPHCWYGRKTDEMGRWTERNILNQKLNKLLMENKSNAK